MLWTEALRLERHLMNAALELVPDLAGELELARQVQTSLLPKNVCCLGSWRFAYSYEPAEAPNSAGEEYGIHRLLDDFREVGDWSANELVRSISERITRFTGGLPLADDRTILVLGR